MRHRNPFPLPTQTAVIILLHCDFHLIKQQECIPVWCIPPASVAMGGGGGLPWEAVCLGGVCLRRVEVHPSSHCMPGYTPPHPLWTEWITHACENITFPQLRLRAAKIKTQKHPICYVKGPVSIGNESQGEETEQFCGSRYSSFGVRGLMYEAVKGNRLRLIWCYGRYQCDCYRSPSSHPPGSGCVGAEVVYTVQDLLNPTCFSLCGCWGSVHSIGSTQSTSVRVWV